MSAAPASVRLVEGAARRFGEIDLIARLGQGGMAEVFLATRRRKPTELLVLKRLKGDLDDPEHRAMFDDEAKIMPLLSHPNIVRTVAVGQEDGQRYLAMEFLDGLPLDQCAAAISRLGERAILHVVAELLSGLHYAHELHGADGSSLEVVHRDVSPHNVFITYEGRVTLVDFGIAKSRTRALHTATGVVRGKLGYMAPEQALCDTVDRRADVFAAGVILWELLANRQFWAGQSDVQILKRMTFGEMPSLREVCPDLSEELLKVVDRALAPKPEDRYSSALAFRTDLVALAADAGPFRRHALGHAVTEAASGYRQALHDVVQSHLEAARSGTLIEEPAPSSEAAPASGAPSSVGAPITAQSDEAPSSSSDDAAPLPERGPESEDTSLGTAVLRTTSSPVTREAVEASLVDSGVRPAPVAPKPARALRRVGFVVAAVVALGLIAFVATGRPKTPAPAASATSTASAAEVSDNVQIIVTVKPTNAVVFLDDMRVVRMPLMSRFPRDLGTHKLRVESPGYEPEMHLLVFDRDVTLAVELSPRESAVAPIASSAASAPTSSSPTPVTSGPRSSSTVRSTASATAVHTSVVDETDPWGHKKPRKN
ncbi:MAG: protein kinase [Polyangiaceae bacterium]